MEATGLQVLHGEVAGECAVPTSSHRTQWRDLGLRTPGCGHGPGLRSHGTEDGAGGKGLWEGMTAAVVVEKGLRILM